LNTGVESHAVRRNALLLAGGMICLSGMIQLVVALSTVTLVAVTGVEGILGLGPAIFLVSGALAVFPAGRLGDRVGRMPVIRVGFVCGILSALVTALGCHTESEVLVIAGFALAGAASTIVMLSRAAAAEMFAPARRARGMSLVLFGAASGAIFGPLVFGPMFSGRDLTPHDLVVPYLASGLFMVLGLALSLAVRPDPKVLGAVYAEQTEHTDAAAPLLDILRRPGVAAAMVAAVASFAVMVGVMNLSGYVAVGRGHEHGDVFTIISVHIVGMYGLILVVGDLIDRIGRRRALVAGLLIMGLSDVVLAPLDSIPGMGLSLFGLGLGWSLSYVAATTELVSLAAPVERGRLIGFTDLLSSLVGASLALGGGALYSAAGAVPLALGAALLAAAPATWIALSPRSLQAAALQPAD
jgi:MFS family permease